jgi:hypothetical protein
MDIARRSSFIYFPMGLLGLLLSQSSPATSPFFLPVFMIQQYLQIKSPFIKNILIVELIFSNPNISLTKKNQRIFLTVNIRVTVPNNRPVNGKMSLSSSFFYDAISHKIFLKDPLLNQMAIDGVDEAGQKLLTQLNPFIGELFNNAPIYELSKTDLTYFPKPPSSIELEDDGVLFRFN